MVKKASKMLAFLTILSSMLVSFSIAFAAETSSSFQDVDSNHKNINAINYLKDLRVFEGYPDGTFQPDRVLNRAEQLKVYMLFHGIDPDENTYKNCFPDVQTQWFAKYICYAKARGWVQGHPDGHFLPASEVNKAEAFKMLGEVQGWDMDSPSENVYPDVKSDAWYAKYVKYAKDKNLFENADLFEPSKGLTRAITAELMYRSVAPLVLEEVYSEELNEEIWNVEVEDIMPVQPIVPVAEYGDAPEDGNAGYAGSYSNVEAHFPTLYFTQNSSGTGAHALNPMSEWLGDQKSLEQDADDVNDPDGVMNLDNADQYDDGLLGITIPLISIPPPAFVTLETTIADDAPDGTRYINMLVDLNMDGQWSGTAAGNEPEWAVKNYEINQDPGTTKTHTLPSFPWSDGFLLTPTTWVRVVITREPINEQIWGNDGWDGSGEFSYGEVEDYYVQLPLTPDQDPQNTLGGRANHGHGLIWGKPAPVMMCPDHRKFGQDVNVIYYTCWVFNYGGRGNVKYDKWLISGGVSVSPTTGIINMPTAPPNPVAGNPFGVVGNPTPLLFKAVRGALPSTWGYRIVGVDPSSTVANSIVDLGLVVEDKEIGFSEDPFEYSDFWTEEGISDYFIYGDEEMDSYPPVILGMDVHELVDEDNQGYSFAFYVNIYDKDTDDSDLDYEWSSDCGEVAYEGNEAILTFNDVSCFEMPFELRVNDGDTLLRYDFADFFAENYLEVESDEPVGEAPSYDGFVYEFVSGGADDDIQVYHISVDASDPEDGDLFYEWTAIDCGDLTGDLFGNKVQWEWSMSEDACIELDTTFNLEITDEDENVIEVEDTVVFE